MIENYKINLLVNIGWLTFLISQFLANNLLVPHLIISVLLIIQIVYDYKNKKSTEWNNNKTTGFVILFIALFAFINTIANLYKQTTVLIVFSFIGLIIFAIGGILLIISKTK